MMLLDKRENLISYSAALHIRVYIKCYLCTVAYFCWLLAHCKLHDVDSIKASCVCVHVKIVRREKAACVCVPRRFLVKSTCYIRGEESFFIM